MLLPRSHPVALPPCSIDVRLVQKLFRGEQDISQFDETFTPPHSSSQTFSTVTRSDLQEVLPSLHPGHG